ncbi:MAG TPA: prolyl oligopeptidase family serine peptidase [Pseudonocardiaceae bacterium]|nr:prolyl oligopeptidase family serine peptidase [Pseudonocardiaceae bacterium]
MTSLPGQLLSTQRFTLGVPDRFTATAGGVLFLRSRAGDDPVNCLWALDADSGEERLLATGMAAYATDSAGELVAYALDGVLRTVGRATRLPAAGPVRDPRPDPTGQRIAYVADGALRVINADGTDDRVLAAPDGPDVTFGVAEHTGYVCPGGIRGFWWAPDGTRLLVARVDSSEVPLWHIANPAEPASAPRTARYAAAGKANADVTLWLTDLDGSRTEAVWDRAAFEYVPGAGWDRHGPYVAVQSRDQHIMRFLGIDPADGATTLLAESHDECWVQPIPGIPARTESGAIVSHADLAGTRHLTVAGEVVTPPGLQVRTVLDVTGDDVLFTASDEAIETHLWSYGPDGLRQLSTETGVHTGVRGHGTLVRVALVPDQIGGRVTVTRDGRSVPIRSLVAKPVLDPHVTRLVLGPRELRGALYLPSWHRPGSGRLPILLDPYGGGGRQQVTVELSWRYLVSQWFAEHGFAVLAVDGAGTPGRGPDWEREVYGDLFGQVVADQVAGVQEAARQHPDLDLERVGIRGWSFGGALAATAVLTRPDVFHAGVAGAGVTDQLLYNAYWRERFLGHPDEFPERYEAASLLRAAPKLARPLLLVHGLADDNVYPVNSLRLSEALLAAGREHELLLLPGVGHQAMGVPVTEGLLTHQLRFLQRHLGDDRNDLG